MGCICGKKQAVETGIMKSFTSGISASASAADTKGTKRALSTNKDEKSDETGVRTRSIRRTDPFNLQRFVDAQDFHLTYKNVIKELSAGKKRSHWMWFIFPQRKGEFPSQMSHKYGITCDEEATAYMEHPVLGPRLVECTNLMLKVQSKTLREILGQPDDVKFARSMDLFSSINGQHQDVFRKASELAAVVEYRIPLKTR